MKKLLLFLLAALVINCFAFSQDNNNYEKYGKIVKFKLSNSMFPHVKRIDGHNYKDKIFPSNIHYSDSTVLVFIPSYFKISKKIDYVIHFHGWWNNVDSVVAQFELIEQFYKSKKNAILIIPQGPKNSPDSFGGKLEEKNTFSKFISELSDSLNKTIFNNNTRPDKIILSGHSGAFRVISFILQKGGMTKQIKEVFLFDALYGQTEKYSYWIDHYDGKLIVIYTDDGGTKDETEKFIDDLRDWEIKFISEDEKEITSKDLSKNRIIFIHTKLNHNQVLYKNENFYNYLISSCLK